MGFSRIVWIMILCSCLVGCATSQKVKVVADITPEGEVTYHTEFVAEF